MTDCGGSHRCSASARFLERECGEASTCTDLPFAQRRQPSGQISHRGRGHLCERSLLWAHSRTVTSAIPLRTEQADGLQGSCRMARFVAGFFVTAILEATSRFLGFVS